MVAFDAQQALVHVSIAVAGNGDNFALLDADLHMASRTAKATGSLLPVNPRCWLIGKDRQRKAGSSGDGRRGSHCGSLDKFSTLNNTVLSVRFTTH